MAGLQGFSGLAPVIVPDPGASAPEIHGGPADPAHGQQFWQEPPRYPWLVYEADTSLGGASAETSIMGAEPAITGSGTDPGQAMMAVSTGSHGAPWPSFGVDDSVVNDREQAAARQAANQDLHASANVIELRRRNTAPYGNKMDLVNEADYVTAGESLLQAVPDQLRGQMGRDRIQGFAPLNSYGFDSAHVRRPRYRGKIPGNFAWLTGRQRPMIVQPLGRQSYPVGDGSPFAGQTPGVGSVDGATLSGVPPEYSPPPPPPTGPALVADDSPAWGWVSG